MSVIGLYRDCLNLVQSVLELKIFQAKVLEIEIWKYSVLYILSDFGIEVVAAVFCMNNNKFYSGCSHNVVMKLKPLSE